jgi:hypothetical protein
MSYKKYIQLMVMVAMSLFLCRVPGFAGDVPLAPQMSGGFPMLAGEKVMIMWRPAPGAVKYKVYKDGKLIGEVPVSPFSAKAPTEPGTYKYTITGVNKDGVEGPASREGELTIAVLSQPQDIKHNFINMVLKLDWKAEPNADIYDIFRADKEEGPYTFIGSTNEAKYFDLDVSRELKRYGKSLFYKIVSKDKFNKKSPDTEFYEVIVKKFEKHMFFEPQRGLVIKATKEEMFVKPDLATVSDVTLLADKMRVVCVDPVSGKIVIIGADGKVIRTVGEVGDKPDQLGSPIRVAVDRYDSIYTLDSKKSKIFAYDMHGELIYAVDYHVITEKEILDRHDGLSGPVTPKLNAIVIIDKTIYAADKVTGAIQLYNRSDGAFIDYLRSEELGNVLSFGTVNKMIHLMGWQLYMAKPLENKVTRINYSLRKVEFDLGISDNMVGAFKMVNGMWYDGGRNVVVADGVNNTVQGFDLKYGKYLYHIGDERGLPDEKSENQKPLTDREFTGPIIMDGGNRFWIYVDKDKGFSVRR